MSEIIKDLVIACVPVICTTIFMWQQTAIQKKQQELSLFKLRMEHIKSLFDIWNTFNVNILYIDNKQVAVISKGIGPVLTISTMHNSINMLIQHNLTTKSLFNSELYELEKALIPILSSLVPDRLINNRCSLKLKDYQNAKKHFDKLFEKYENFIKVGDKICK